jgi:GDSL-like Lipase/Acylhydrolase family
VDPGVIANASGAISIPVSIPCSCVPRLAAPPPRQWPARIQWAEACGRFTALFVPPDVNERLFDAGALSEVWRERVGGPGRVVSWFQKLVPDLRRPRDGYARYGPSWQPAEPSSPFGAVGQPRQLPALSLGSPLASRRRAPQVMGRSFRPALWLGPAALLWGVIAFVARIPTVGAATVTDVLFVLALPLSYVAGVGAAVQATARPRSAVMRAAAMTLGLLMALAMLELAAAARLVHWELLLTFLSGEQQHYVPDPDLGFRHTPNARGSSRPRSDVEVAWGLPASRFDRVTVTYDRRGYRNATELTRTDIVLIGDSYVEGHYVSDDQIVSRLLQDRLGQPVANLGVAGYGTAQELVVLKLDAMLLEPRVVIWFFFEGNDLYNDQEFENTLLAPREVRASAWTERRGWWRRSLVRNAHAQLRLMLYPLVPSYCPHFGVLTAGPHRGQKILFGPEAAFRWTEFEQGRWERAQQTLREAVRFTREHNVNLLLVYVPIKFRVYRDFIELPPRGELGDWTLWPLPDLFAQFCRADRLACLDLTGPLRDSVRAGSMPHAFADSHWSPEGHQLVALRLEEVLESLGWLRASGEPRNVWLVAP